jgi:hypothetical protein
MDVNTPGDQDLSKFEHRLKSWRPSAEGLDADAMLFAAGFAAARSWRDRRAGPVLCGVLASVALGLGAWALTERAERLALASRIPTQGPVANRSYVSAGPVLPELSSAPSPDSYLSLSRHMEQDPAGWLASLEPVGSQSIEPPPPQPAILRAGQRDALSIQ